MLIVNRNVDVNESHEEANIGYFIRDLCLSKFYDDEHLLDLSEKNTTIDYYFYEHSCVAM